MPEQAFDRMNTNALEFLRLAILDCANRPNQMAIRVYTAIEIILKARLLHEHWSLMVSKNAVRKAFEEGDFVSVTFEESCKRLAEAVQSPIPTETRDKFNALRKQRNIIVHFTPAKSWGDPGHMLHERFIKETTLSAWEALHDLMQNDWKDVFGHLSDELDRIAGQIRSVIAPNPLI